MSHSFPYTYVACPCTSQTSSAVTNIDQRRASRQVRQEDSADEQEDQAFNPHDPRAKFSLYISDHLLYCDECHQIRCPRCWSEEITNWYCPSCLFEVPSSVVKSDGNRYGELTYMTMFEVLADFHAGVPATATTAHYAHRHCLLTL